VDDVAAVSQVHCPCDGCDHLGGFARTYRASLQPLGECAALDKLERGIGQALVLADFMDLHNVRVLQAGHRLSLGPKALPLPFASMAAAQDHLEGDHPLQGEMPGFVDHAHGAAAENSLDVVAGNSRGRRREALGEPP
jgi:hypothetical protein